VSAERGGAASLTLSIDLGALAENWKRLAAIAAPAESAAVVKADAYGIGIEQAAPALVSAGCRTLFVALPEEGARARAVAPDAAIYVLNGFFAETAALYRSARLRPVLNSLDEAAAWGAAALGAPSALQVDTGMNRLGLNLRESIEIARRPGFASTAMPRLLISHLACADTPAHPANAAQLALFREIRSRFPSLPASFANSAGIFLGSDYRFDMVRPGIALYGAAFAAERNPLKTVATLKARILQVRDASAGETVGYGAGQRLGKDSHIGILAAGYADGYHRLAGSSDARPGAHAYLRGRLAPLVGRVSMDLMAIDVTGIPGASAGDWVELFGPNMPIDEVAEAAGTVAYELLTALSRRAERQYIGRDVPAAK
jgi:alanine racemase